MPLFSDSTRASQQRMLARVLLLGALILILQAPMAAIQGLIYERSATRKDALDDITRTAGGSQVVLGPVLAVPYKVDHLQTPAHGRPETAVAYFLPQTLAVSGKVATEERYRGIFEIPVYSATLHFSGAFVRPNFAALNITEDNVLWDRAVLTVGLDSAKSIRDKIRLKWGDADIDFLPGQPGEDPTAQGVRAAIPDLSAPAPARTFEFDLTLNGSGAIGVVPTGDESNVSLTSSWPDPDFIGDYSPTEREITGDGFKASWKVLSLGRGFPEHWIGYADAASKDFFSGVRNNYIGVNFLSPVDTYRMNDRLIKYELLIVFLTFLTFYLFEVFNRFFIHPIQYLLVGAGLCLFYMLTLSFSEHLGFGAAYVIASLAAISLITFYSTYLLRGKGRAAVLGSVLASQYAYFYVLLQEQSYSLLLGSLGLTAILAAVMYLTRNIDWYQITIAPVTKTAGTPEADHSTSL